MDRKEKEKSEKGTKEKEKIKNRVGDSEKMRL